VTLLFAETAFVADLDPGFEVERAKFISAKDRARAADLARRVEKAEKLASWASYDEDAAARLALALVRDIGVAAELFILEASGRRASQLHAVLAACRGASRPSEVHQRLAEMHGVPVGALDVLCDVHGWVLENR
jgi:hypothetical protein